MQGNAVPPPPIYDSKHSIPQLQICYNARERHTTTERGLKPECAVPPPPDGWLEDQEQQFFYNGIRALEKCWTRCILVAGEYVKKSQNTIW